MIDPAKLERVARLAGQVKLAIAVDSTLGVERLAAALQSAGTRADVFVEVDVGHGRCGVAPVAAGALAHQVVSNGLRFAGLQAYHGRAQHLRGADEREAAIRHAVGLARAAQASVSPRPAWPARSSPAPAPAPSSTRRRSGLYGELQPGSYLFMDRDYADNQASPRRAALRARAVREDAR